MKGKIKNGAKKRWVGILILALVVVLAGCQQQTQSETEKVTPQGEETQTQEAQETQEQKVDWSKYKTLADLMGLKVGVYCEGSEKTSEGIVNYKYWVKSENMRVEVEKNGEKAVAIVKEDGTYFTGKEMGQTGCDWIMIPKQKYEQQPAQPVEKDYTQPEKVDLSKFNCRVYPVSDDMFQTPGKVCSLEDIINQYMSRQMPAKGG